MVQGRVGQRTQVHKHLKTGNVLAGVSVRPWLAVRSSLSSTLMQQARSCSSSKAATEAVACQRRLKCGSMTATRLAAVSCSLYTLQGSRESSYLCTVTATVEVLLLLQRKGAAATVAQRQRQQLLLQAS